MSGLGSKFLESIGIGGGEEATGENNMQEGMPPVVSDRQTLPRGAAPVVSSMSAISASATNEPLHIYTDEERSKKYYGTFMELIKPMGEPYFKFLAAMESMREFIDSEEKLVKAVIKSLKTQNNLEVGQVAAAIATILSQIETVKNEEFAQIEKDDLLKNSAAQAQLNGTIQEIADLESKLKQAQLQKEKLEKDLELRRADGQQRKRCLEVAAKQLSGEVSSTGNKINHYREG